MNDEFKEAIELKEAVRTVFDEGRKRLAEELKKASESELPASPRPLPRCPYSSDDRHENHRILHERYFDCPWEGFYMHRGIRAVLVSGGIGDYAVYLGAGTAEWVSDHGSKLSFDVAKGFFPRITVERYRE